MSTVVQHRPLLTVEETAAWLRVSEKTVRRLISRAELPALRVGGQIRVDESELEEWLYGPDAPLLLSARPQIPAAHRETLPGQSSSGPRAGGSGEAA